MLIIGLSLLGFLSYWLLSTSASSQVFELKVGEQVVEILEPRGFLQKRVGLLNCPKLSSDAGLFLSGVRKVHTRGMHYNLDLLFVDRNFKILGIERHVEPGRAGVEGPRGTKGVLELKSGVASKVRPGDLLIKVLL